MRPEENYSGEVDHPQLLFSQYKDSCWDYSMFSSVGELLYTSKRSKNVDDIRLRYWAMGTAMRGFSDGYVCGYAAERRLPLSSGCSLDTRVDNEGKFWWMLSAPVVDTSITLGISLAGHGSVWDMLLDAREVANFFCSPSNVSFRKSS